jgi:hypothetical protein
MAAAAMIKKITTPIIIFIFFVNNLNLIIISHFLKPPGLPAKIRQRAKWEGGGREAKFSSPR